MKKIRKMNRFIIDVGKVLNVPPEELSIEDKIVLRFNGFFNKSYCAKWGNGITYVQKLKAA
jgi:hypothetical protein